MDLFNNNTNKLPVEDIYLISAGVLGAIGNTLLVIYIFFNKKSL